MHFHVTRSIIIRKVELLFQQKKNLGCSKAFSVKIDVAREFGFELGED